MYPIDIDPNRLISALLALAETERVCILDSCGVGHLGSHLMIAGIRPTDVIELTANGEDVLNELDKRFATPGQAGFFTLSYELGRKYLNVGLSGETIEPDLFYAAFDCLVVHDYTSGKTFLSGNGDAFSMIVELLRTTEFVEREFMPSSPPRSNFTRAQYISAANSIRESIRNGDTYQTNLTQKLTIELPPEIRPEDIFARLRRDHPAPFAALIKRENSIVVSASPERFFSVRSWNGTRRITASPIKGTRRRGADPAGDEKLRDELINSQKDRAENTMIVDLLRNDLGRVCEYGSVVVEKLCDVEEHPSLFHLVSTVSGTLRHDVKPSDILRSLFPCGSITGAPKIRTMQIIDEIEPDRRGLSMGAIGYQIPETGFEGLKPGIDTSVAIRTMVFRDGIATFNVGGGVVIDSDPSSEYEESLLKAEALLAAMGVELSTRE